MSLQERVSAYAASSEGLRFPDSIPRVSASGRWLEGHWIMGQDYRATSPLYGAYPPRYLTRVQSLFPEIHPLQMLHLFSGSVQIGSWTRVDSCLTRVPAPSVYADVEFLPFRAGSFSLILADPPYSKEDAKKYGTGMPNRKVCMEEIASVSTPGNNLVWLDTVLPMFRKAEWRWWGSITVLRSTNHRVREAFFFERQ